MNEVITFDWGHGGVQYSLKKLTRPKEEFSTWKTYSNRGIVKKSERKVESGLGYTFREWKWCFPVTGTSLLVKITEVCDLS